MHLKLTAGICMPLLLGACTIFPEMNPPEESQARAPRAARLEERIAPVAKNASPSVVYDSGVWLGRGKAVLPPSAPMQSWEVYAADKTLKTTVARWAASAGWQLSWELPVDYELEASTSIPGSFEEAMEAVAKSMNRAEMPMKMIFYRSNKVIRIVAKGAE